MKHPWLIVCLAVLLVSIACGKKEPAPAPVQKQEPVAQVQPEPEPAPPPAPAPPPEPKPEPVKKVSLPPGTYTIQVAAWETYEDAQKLAAFYQRKGYDSRVEEADLSSGRWYRVRIGKYDNPAKAKEAADLIAETYKSDIWLVRL
ncbi:MAG: SPOR domain-containing protein [Candidatus Glassbacteria bacterium]|nr:SPOR domain-containing protein [Candidatus Glassbacteria bacterium]